MNKRNIIELGINTRVEPTYNSNNVISLTSRINNSIIEEANTSNPDQNKSNSLEYIEEIDPCNRCYELVAEKTITLSYKKCKKCEN